jgi:hypothetical protein
MICVSFQIIWRRFLQRYLAHWRRRGSDHLQPETSRHETVTTNFVENRTPFIVESDMLAYVAPLG